MMKKSILTTLVSLLILSVVAQTNVKRGDRLLKSFRFKDATEAYKAVVKKAPNDVC